MPQIFSLSIICWSCPLPVLNLITLALLTPCYPLRAVNLTKGQPMGFFNNSSPSSQLSPLSLDRVKQVLDSMQLKYQIDDDGDIIAGFEQGFFYFFIRGNSQEILHVRGTWYGVLPKERHAGLTGICEQWNRDKIWPKVYPTVRSTEGDYTLVAEHTVDYEHGLTDDQLRQHLMCAIDTSNRFFSEASEIFPEGMPEEE